MLDFGAGRVCMQEPSGFTIGLVKHPQGRRQPFSELSTKLDDIGLTATDRGELVQWEQHLVAADASPIQDTLLDHHLNFRDPDGIPLELRLPGWSERPARGNVLICR